MTPAIPHAHPAPGAPMDPRQIARHLDDAPAAPGPAGWGCQRCGAAYFGTPPGDGRCPGCRGHG